MRRMILVGTSCIPSDHHMWRHYFSLWVSVPVHWRKKKESSCSRKKIKLNKIKIWTSLKSKVSNLLDSFSRSRKDWNFEKFMMYQLFLTASSGVRIKRSPKYVYIINHKLYFSSTSWLEFLLMLQNIELFFNQSMANCIVFHWDNELVI